MNEKLKSIAVLILSISLISLIIVVFYFYKQIHEENINLRNEIVEFKNISETIARSSVKWVTKDDLNNHLKNILTKDEVDIIKKDLSILNSRLFSVGQTVGTIRSHIVKLENSTKEGPENQVVVCNDGRIIDVYGYTKKAQIKELIDSNAAPLASVQFNASKDKPWSYEVFKRDYKISTVIGKKDSGQLTFHQKLQYVVPEVDKNKTYNIDILSSEFSQTQLKNSMFWFNPILDFNVFLGGEIYKFNNNENISYGVDAGLSLSSYGETRADSWFRLFRLGIGYDFGRHLVGLSVAPIMFNAGKPLPLLTNLYIGPRLSVDSSGLLLNVGIGSQF